MLSIGAAALQTGIQVETLRKWEARYGFPVPIRSVGGQRLYRDSDIDLLQRIGRAIASGQRAGDAIRSLLSKSSGSPTRSPRNRYGKRIKQAVAILQSNDIARYEKFVEDELVRLGLSRFCLEFALPLIGAVGESWQRGVLPIYAEHVFSRHLHFLMSQQSSERSRGRADSLSFLLALPAGETHGLALAILNALLLNAGFSTVLMLNGLPASEIAAAALAYKVDVVALSCSQACAKRVLHDELTELRRVLPGNVVMWAGGSGVSRLAVPVNGIEYFHSMEVALASANTQKKTINARKHNA